MRNVFASLATATEHARQQARADGLPFIADQWSYLQAHGMPGRHFSVLFDDDRGGHVLAYWNGSFYETPDSI